MKGNVIIFFCVFTVLLISVLLFIKSPEKITINTFNIYNEKTFYKKVVFLNQVIIKASSDDYVEQIEKTLWDYVESGTVLMKMEDKEEGYQLAKAKNEFAISLLNSGKSVQEEKKQAVELAEKKLENTKIRTPIDGYILNIPVNEKLFVSKGTILTEILPSDSSACVPIIAEEEALLKKAEFIQFVLKPLNEQWLMEEMQFIEHDNTRLLVLSLDIGQLNKDCLNKLYCEIKVTYSEIAGAWIPVEYVHNDSVLTEEDKKKEIEIIDRKNDLYLVHGLKDGDILIKKR